MKIILVLLAVAMVAVFMVACGRDETAEPPAATTTVEQPGTASPADVAPVTAQTWIDDVTIGHELAADGSMVTVAVKLPSAKVTVPVGGVNVAAPV